MRLLCAPLLQVTAVAYDNPIPGFGTRNCINLRLWAAKPSKEFDLEAFNTGARAPTLSAAACGDAVLLCVWGGAGVPGRVWACRNGG